MSNRHAGGTGGANDYMARLNAMDDEIGARHNLLHNGAFQIWQRGTPIAIAAARTYTTDRWLAYRGALATGATVSQQAGVNNKWCVRVQRDSGNTSTQAVVFVQQVEDIDIIPYRAQYLTLKFRARLGASYSAAGALLSAAVNTGTGFNEANDFAYTGLISTTTYFQLTGSFQSFQVPALLVPGNTGELAVVFGMAPTGTAGVSDYFELEEAQLVPSQYPGNFPYRDPQVEQLLCQRFARYAFGVGAGVSTTTVAVGISFDVPMRIAPAIIAPAAVTVRDPTAGTITQSAASATWQVSHARGGEARFINLTGVTAGRPYIQDPTTPVLLSADL